MWNTFNMLDMNKEKKVDNADVSDIHLEVCRKHKKIKWKEKWLDFGETMALLMSFNTKHYDIDVSKQKCPQCRG